MSTLELWEFKLYLKEILDNYAKCIVMGCTGIVCEEEGWYSQVMH